MNDKSIALIGYTGFVGGNLDRQLEISHRYNSKNIAAIRGKEFDLVICAGVSATKWLANRDPVNDKKHIKNLLQALDTISCKKLILISTIDVYPEPYLVDEDTPIDLNSCHPYGKHRLQLERSISRKFDTHIIRLPALFGEGLKKNVVYDFLNDNNIDRIDPDGLFQFYCLDHLGNDISVVLEHNIRTLNICSEPLSADEVSIVCRGRACKKLKSATAPASYDVRSLYAGKFGGVNGYMHSKQEVLGELCQFVENYVASI